MYTIVYAAQSAGYVVRRAHGAFFFKANDCTPRNRTALCRDQAAVLAQALGGLNASLSADGARISSRLGGVPFDYETAYIYNLT